MSALVRGLKAAVVGVIGRPLANRLSAPYHDWQATRRTRAFLAGLPREDLCLNLGCGEQPLPGFVNVDHARGPQVDVVWDLRRPLPLTAGSCAAILSEHVIEHLTPEHGLALLRECFRLLRPGGVLRVSTPDAGKYLRSYAGDRAFLSSPEFDRPAATAMDRVNQMMREGGQHLWCYDEESLGRLLADAGFRAPRGVAFGESAHPRLRGVDSAGRRFESLYMDADKG